VRQICTKKEHGVSSLFPSECMHLSEGELSASTMFSQPFLQCVQNEFTGSPCLPALASVETECETP